jgi:ArsR family transcriptional regulator, arsenate/arsenite/antimonite-responsive transcriptional repressor
MEKLTRAAQAISDETRIRILNVLMAQECCVCEVMQALEISQTRASRNLKILDDAGFLNMRTDGLYTLYSLREAAGDGFHAELLNAVKKEVAANEEARKDALRLKRSRRVGPGCQPAKCAACT